MALHNATIVDVVPYITTDRLILRSEAEESSPSIQKTLRFAVVNEHGKLSALERDVMGFTNEGSTMHATIYMSLLLYSWCGVRANG